MTTGKRQLVLASSRTDAQAWAEITAGQRPRLDYLAIADALGADVLDTRVSDGIPRWRRQVERALASDLTQADLAWGRRGAVSAWLSTSEKVGLPLALHGRSQVPHVLIAHNLRSARKRLLHRLTGVLRTGFQAIVCLSRSQEAFLRDVVNLPAARVHRLYDNVDTAFWRPEAGEAPDGDYVLAVGRENRDYGTALSAARKLGLPLTIVGSSLWSSRALGLDPSDLPANVTVRQEFLSYTDLRALYAGARLVVVPLHACDYAAGVNGALEAMAMGKASVVSGTEGLAEYVRDGETNRVVPPGDAAALADAIGALWDDAPARRAMGAAGRARVERGMSLDGYAAQVAEIVRDVMEEEKRS